MHGGFDEQMIVDKVDEATRMCTARPTERVCLFFDEINTAPCQGLFKVS